jgi:Flp pilus assembly protein TadG
MASGTLITNFSELRLKLVGRPRRQRTRGAELVEFSLTLFPLLMFITAFLSISWSIFARSALQYAVKTAVRNGITIDKVAAGNSDLTSIVKNLVQTNSFGFLRDTSLVHVHYYQPPSTGSTGPVLDVSTVTTGSTPGNYPGNIMVVSVDGYALSPLIARIFGWNRIDKSSSTISVSSADLIEQIDPNDLAPLGTAP